MILEPIGLAVFLFQTRVLCLIKPGIIGEFFRYLYRDLVDSIWEQESYQMAASIFTDEEN